MRHFYFIFCFISLIHCAIAGELRLPIRVAVPPNKTKAHALEAGFRDMVRSALETSSGIYVCPLDEQRTILKALQAPDPAKLEAIGVDCVISTSMAIEGEKLRVVYGSTSRSLPTLDTPTVTGEVAGTVDELPEMAFKIAAAAMKPWGADLRKPTVILGTNRKVMDVYGGILADLEMANCKNKLDGFVQACLSVQSEKGLGLREFQWLTRLVILNASTVTDKEKKRVWFEGIWSDLRKAAGPRPLTRPFLAEALMAVGKFTEAEAELAAFDTYRKSMDPVRFRLPKVYNVAREEMGQNVWTVDRAGDVLFVKRDPRELQAIKVVDGSVLWRQSLPRGGYPGFFGVTDKALYYRTLKEVLVLDKTTGNVLHNVTLTGNPYKNKWLQGGNGLQFALNRDETSIILLNMGVFHHRDQPGSIRTSDACTIEHVDLKTNTVTLLHKEHSPSISIRFHLVGDVIVFAHNPGGGNRSRVVAYDITTGKTVETPGGLNPREFWYGNKAGERVKPKVKVELKHEGRKATSVVTRLSDGKIIFDNRGQGTDERVIPHGDYLYVLRKNRYLTKQRVDTGAKVLQIPIKDEYCHGFCKRGILLYSYKNKAVWCPNESVKSIDERLVRKAEYLAAVCKDNQGRTEEAIAAYDALAPYALFSPEVFRKSGHACFRTNQLRRAWFRYDAYVAALGGYAPRTKDTTAVWELMQRICPVVKRANVNLTIFDKRSHPSPSQASLSGGVLLAGPNAGTVSFDHPPRRIEVPADKTVRYFNLGGSTALCQYSSKDRGADGIVMVRVSDGKILWQRPLNGAIIRPQACRKLEKFVWMQRNRGRSGTTLSIAGASPEKPISTLQIPDTVRFPQAYELTIKGSHAVAALDKTVTVVNLENESILWKAQADETVVLGVKENHLLLQQQDKANGGQRVLRVLALKTGKLVKQFTGLPTGRARPVTTYANRSFFYFQDDLNAPPTLVCFDFKTLTVAWKLALPRGALDAWTKKHFCDGTYLMLARHFREAYRVVRVSDGKLLGAAQLPNAKNGALHDWKVAKFLENGHVSTQGMDLVVRQAPAGTSMYRFRNIHSFLTLCSFKPEPGVNPITVNNDSTFVAFGNQLGKKRMSKPCATEILALTAVDEGKSHILSKGKREGVPSAVTNGVYGHDGKKLLAVDDTHTVHLLDSTKNKVKRTFKGTDKVLALAIGDTHLAVSDLNKRIYLYSKETGERTGSVTVKSLVKSMRFSPDGKRLAVGDAHGTIQLYDCNGQLWTTLKGHSFSIRDLCFVSDGSQLVSASNDLSIRVWDLTNGKSVKEFIVHDTVIAGLAVTQDRLFSTDVSGTIHSWSTKTWKPAPPIITDLHNVSAISASPTGKVIVLGTQDGSLLTITFDGSK